MAWVVPHHTLKRRGVRQGGNDGPRVIAPVAVAGATAGVWTSGHVAPPEGTGRLQAAGPLGKSRFRAPTRAFPSFALGTGSAGGRRAPCVGGAFTRGKPWRRGPPLRSNGSGRAPPGTRQLPSGPLPVLLAGVYSSQRPAAVGAITAPFVEMRKVKLRDVEWFCQSPQPVEAQV